MFKKGDRIRRIKGDNDGPMRIGTEWVVVQNQTHLHSVRVGHDPNNPTDYWDCQNFELVVSKPETSTPCIVRVPAREAQTKIVRGPLCKGISVNHFDTQVRLMSENGSIGHFGHQDLLDAADAFIKLAQAMKEIEGERN